MFEKITGEGGTWDEDGDGGGGEVSFFDSGEFIGVLFSFWGWGNLL